MPPRRLLLSLLILLAPAACEGPGDLPASGVPASLSPLPSPGPDPRVVFSVKGDWGAATREQAAVTSRMCEVRNSTPFDIVVTTGDNFYRPDGRATQANYFGPEACLTSYPGHQWRAVWGNHDIHDESTGTVLGAERTYTWTAGPAQFFMLDSNNVADDVQTAWLATELAASRAQVKIAVYHHPGLTAGLHDPSEAVQRRWMPLFEQHGVKLVLNGHNHAYEHLVQSGVHYVVTGGGGASIYPCVGDPPGLVACVAISHFLIVDVEGTKISVTALGTDGRTIDRWSIN
ncbi:metallophosphoesterase [soil metagenome]